MIDLESNELLTAEGLTWGDGTVTYDLATQTLKRHNTREGSVYVRTQRLVSVQQALKKRSARLYQAGGKIENSGAAKIRLCR